MTELREITHYVDYSFRNIGHDVVTSGCGKRILINQFSTRPTCAVCRAIVFRERLRQKRKDRQNWLREHMDDV